MLLHRCSDSGLPETGFSCGKISRNILFWVSFGSRVNTMYRKNGNRHHRETTYIVIIFTLFAVGNGNSRWKIIGNNKVLNKIVSFRCIIIIWPVEHSSCRYSILIMTGRHVVIVATIVTDSTRICTSYCILLLWCYFVIFYPHFLMTRSTLFTALRSSHCCRPFNVGYNYYINCSLNMWADLIIWLHYNFQYILCVKINVLYTLC